jgi:predicted methyltransferase
MSVERIEGTVTKGVTLKPEEAKKVLEVCKSLGYRQWAPCLRHLVLKCVEVRCWEKQGG